MVKKASNKILKTVKNFNHNNPLAIRKGKAKRKASEGEKRWRALGVRRV